VFLPATTGNNGVKQEDNAAFGNGGGAAQTASGSSTPALAFGGGSPASTLAFGGQQNQRTIYSNNSNSPFGVKKEEGGNDVDDYGMTATTFGGRTTGMGRVVSGGQESQATGNDSEPNRKRLRRGPNALGDESASSSRAVSTPGSNLASPGDSDPNLASQSDAPSTFTAGLQNRLADFNVDSGPPSSASSAYGGNGMQRDNSWQGEDDKSKIQTPATHPSGRPMRSIQQQQLQQQQQQQQQTPGGSVPSPLTPGVSPPMGYPGAPPPSQSPYANYSPLPQSSIPPSAAAPAPAVGQDQGFEQFLGMVGSNFTREQAYRAWLQSGRNDMAAIALLVDAKPVTSSSSSTSMPNQSMYAQVNSPLSTPGGQHYAQQQVGQGRTPIQVLTRPAQQQQQPGMSPMGYQQQRPPMQAQPGMPQQQPYAYSQQPRASYPASAPHSGLSKEHIENFRRLQQKQQLGQATPIELSQLQTYMQHLQAAQVQAQRQAAQQAAAMGQRGMPPQQQYGYANGQMVSRFRISNDENRADPFPSSTARPVDGSLRFASELDETRS